MIAYCLFLSWYQARWTWTGSTLLIMHSCKEKYACMLISNMRNFRQIWFWFMVFNATFNNISAISWRSVLLVEETGKNHRPVEVTDKLYHITLYHRVHLAWTGFELTTLIVIDSCKSNYHTITCMTDPLY